MKKTILFIASLLVFSLGTSAEPVTIVGYEVLGRTGDEIELPVNTLSSGITATPVTRSDEINASNFANSFNSNNWHGAESFDQDSHYLTFTIETLPGFTVSIDELSYNMESTNTAPNTGRWGYVINEGNFVFQPEFIVAAGTGGGDGDWENIGLADVSGTIEFRYWQYGTQRVDTGSTAAPTSSGASRIRNLSGEDLVLTGTVIPEPASIGLLVLVGGVFLIRRRLHG